MATLEILTPSAPAFDPPLDKLLSCHDLIRRFCDRLDQLLPYITEYGVNDVVKNDIETIVSFFDAVCPAHHGDEEDELFPILEARVPTAAPKIAQLRAEHGYLHSCWNALRDTLLAVQSGDSAALSPNQIEEFVRQYRQHAAIEEAWLIPTANQVMTQEEKDEAGRHMAAGRDAIQ